MMISLEIITCIIILYKSNVYTYSNVDNWVQRSKDFSSRITYSHPRPLERPPWDCHSPSIDHALSSQWCSGCYVCLVLSVVTVHLEWACPTNLLIGNIHRLVCLCRCTLTFVTEGYVWCASPTGMCLCRTTNCCRVSACCYNVNIENTIIQDSNAGGL